MAIDYKIVEKPSTISNLVFDKKDGRTRLIEIFRIDYGSAEGKKRHLLFEKIANPWFESESPRWSTSAYLQTSETETLFQTKEGQKTGTSMVASKYPVKLAKKAVALTQTIRNYVGDRVTSYFIPKAIKDEKLKKEIVKKLTNAGFKPVNHKSYGISFPSPSAWMQTLIMTDGIPKEALNMNDLSKVQFADDFNKGKTTSARQQLDKNKQQLQTQSENKKMKITKKELVNIIKEEVEKALEEQSEFSPLDSPSQMLKKAIAKGTPSSEEEAPPEESEIFNQSLPANGVEHPKFGKIPYTDEEMTAFFAGVPLGGDVFSGEAWGGGVDALAKDDKFQSASKKGRLLILKVATKYIKGGSLKDMSIEGLPDEDLKKSEYRKLKKLYRKNHPNIKGMMRMRAARKNKKDFEAAHGSMSPEEYAATVSGEDFEAPVNTTAPSKDTMMTGIPRDDNDIPMINPGLPKNWRELPRDSKERVDYRNWKKTYGDGGSGAKSGSKMSPKRMRGIMNKADSLVAKVYDQHKNRPEEYTVKRLKNRKSFEHRDLQTALKLYQKAARAGDKRAAKDVGTVKKLLQGKFGEVFGDKIR